MSKIGNCLRFRVVVKPNVTIRRRNPEARRNNKSKIKKKIGDIQINKHFFI